MYTYTYVKQNLFNDAVPLDGWTETAPEVVLGCGQLVAHSVPSGEASHHGSND